jgi:hypothetical protein
VAYDGPRLIGSLPLVVRECPTGAVANSLPFYGSNGSCLVDPACTNGRAVRQALFAALLGAAQEHGWQATTLITSPWETDLDFYQQTAARYRDSRIGQLTPLYTDGAGDPLPFLMERFHYKTRNMVRKSLREGFTVTSDWTEEALEFLVTTHQANMAVIGGLAKDRKCFEQLGKLLPASQRRLYVAHLGKQPVAALLLLYFNKTVEYYTPVIRQEYRSLQPLSYLIITAMCQAAREGYEWWNWGGTWDSQDGVYRFKSRWGSVDRPYYYYTYAHQDMSALLDLGKEGLLRQYRHFFVLPFTALGSNRQLPAA